MSSSNQECGDVISDGQYIAHEESMGMEPTAAENWENFLGSCSANNKFVFDDWARTNELSRKTTAVLRREECTSQRALSTLTPEEIKELSFPIGQRNLLNLALANLKSAWSSDVVITPQSSDHSMTSNRANIPAGGTAPASNMAAPAVRIPIVLPLLISADKRPILRAQVTI